MTKTNNSEEINSLLEQYENVLSKLVPLMEEFNEIRNKLYDLIEEEKNE